VNYYRYVNENNNSLLARTYGLYTLKVGFINLTFILMENVAPIGNKLVLRRFDLKGSLLGRETKKLRLHHNLKTLKDKDLLEIKRMDPNLMNFIDKSVITILETLKQDLRLLRKSSLMDYSLFITICEKPDEFDISNCLVNNRVYYSDDYKRLYFVGVIDYLTKFNNYKILENKYKSIFNYSNRTKISAVNPVLYAERFYDFMNDEIFNFKAKESKK
jgi:hypothetical protein